MESNLRRASLRSNFQSILSPMAIHPPFPAVASRRVPRNLPKRFRVGTDQALATPRRLQCITSMRSRILARAGGYRHVCRHVLRTPKQNRLGFS